MERTIEIDMKKALGTIAVFGLLAGSMALAESTTLTGVVTDQMCGVKHMMAGNAAKCTRACVKEGSPYALAVGEKIYTLKGHEADLDKFAGDKVTVKGTVSGTTVQVSSVAAAR